MRYIKLVQVTVNVQGKTGLFTTQDVVRHSLDLEPKFVSTGAGVRNAVAIETAFAEAEAASRSWAALEDEQYNALQGALEKPEKGYPTIALFDRKSGDLVERVHIVRQLGPIFNALFDAPKKRPEDYDTVSAPSLPVSVTPVPEG